MVRILTISSQVIHGPVGNTASVPALQAKGHEVMQVPTVLLSHHPGHGQPVVQRTSPEMLESFLMSVAAQGALDTCAAVMTGYFASAQQIHVVERLLADMLKANPKLEVLVDPVLGDHGKLYVPLDVAISIKTRLLPVATMTTPNHFELEWLEAPKIDESAMDIARRLGPREVIVTSLPLAEDRLGTMLVTADDTRLDTVRKRDHVPHGTGDFLAGCYLSERLSLPAPAAFNAAMDRLHKAVAKSGQSAVLRVN